jgi:acyl-CoA reductase-like NAD-dependent aldehyde dehydrogenase
VHQPVGQFIDGAEWAGGAGGHMLPLVSPVDDAIVGYLSECPDPAMAVDAAARAHDRGAWRHASAAERAAVLTRIASGIRAQARPIAEADTRVTGLPLHGSTLRHVEAAAGWFDHFARRLGGGDRHLEAPPHVSAHVARAPHGVVALFTPWNIPAMSAALKSAAALAMGNAVVLKPSELAPASAPMLARIASDAGLPDGQFNVVQGRGATVGAALAADVRVRAISFTGGAEGGAAVAAAAARTLCPVTLELGGKSAFILDSDAPLPAALDALLAAAFANNGQACLAPSRLLLHERLAAHLLPELSERIAAISLADPMARDCRMGPLVSRTHRKRVLERIDRAVALGDRLLVGGTVPRQFEAGAWFRPALIAPAANDSPAVQEEFFAPVLTVQTFATAAEALTLADSTPFGLALYVWSRSPEMIAAARRSRAGTICINTPFHRLPDAPFGGLGASGFGREGGDASMAFFSAETTILEGDLEHD